MQHESILIIDFGSQVTQLIARRIREHHTYCEIHPYNHVDMALIDRLSPKGIIFSGGPDSVHAQEAPTISKDLFDLNIPILGICYGQQLMCHLLGGIINSEESREFGKAELEILQDSPLFAGIWKKNTLHTVWMSHGDHVETLPAGFHIIGSSEGAPCAAIANEEKQFYGLQFHPEVVHTPEGSELLKNFIQEICNCQADWTMESFKEATVKSIRTLVGDQKVVAGVSGGVDSTVLSVLLHEAIGDQLQCIFVDTGLLRKGERKEVEVLFESLDHIPLKSIDASEIFLQALEGITDPEQKRKIIGKCFIDVFDNEANAIEGAAFLGQGTLYPDVIESIAVHSDKSSTIKSHHNVGGLPDHMQLALIEPLKELFKDEVRALGLTLGIPETMINRHPFPGPGLAIRIPGEITKEKITILQEADHIYLSTLHANNIYNDIWQAFAVLLPVQTVGVMGDSRTYEYVLAVRAVTSQDGMTADIYDFTSDFLRELSTKIINHVKGINRVVYDITTKPPGTIEWE